jgi:hypothetical protein
MMAGSLQACLKRIKRAKREVDRKARDSTSLKKYMVSLPSWKGRRAYSEGSCPQGCHQRWGGFDWERLGLAIVDTGLALACRRFCTW